MSLTDGALAALAGQAADLVAPDAQVRVRPPANDDPYRWGGHGWLVHIDPNVEVWIPAESSPTGVLYELIDHLHEVSESKEYWGRAVPGCPGHKHMATTQVDGNDVVLRCAQTGEIVQRITPEVLA